MPLPPVTLLDAAQIIQLSYDEPNRRLRTDASLSIDSAVISVDIQDTTDSIKIGDGTGPYLDINPDGSINAIITGGIVSGTFTSSGLSTGLRVQSIIVTDVPTKLPTTSLTNRNALSMRVWGANTVYFGLSSVTSSTGYPKRQYEEMVLDIKDNSNVDMYGVCATGLTCEVRILELA